jgi:hypothetical protein
MCTHPSAASSFSLPGTSLLHHSHQSGPLPFASFDAPLPKLDLMSVPSRSKAATRAAHRGSKCIPRRSVDADLEPEGTQRNGAGVEASGFTNMDATAGGGQWVSAVARDGRGGWRTFLYFGGAGAGAGVRLCRALGRRHRESRREVRSGWSLVRLPAMVMAKGTERAFACCSRGHVKAPFESTTRLRCRVSALLLHTRIRSKNIVHNYIFT